MNRLKYLIVLFILILGFWLRSDNYTTWPRHGATFDEFAWTWLGINLVQHKIPESWSRHPQYQNREYLKYQGAAFLLVKPYLEHPPLFGLVAGSFAMLNGASDMYHVTLAGIRPLALILGVLSIFTVFLLAKELYGINAGIISSLLYATIPTIAVGSRIVQNENFLIPMWLLSLYLLARYLKTKNILTRNLAILIGGLMPLAKVPWFVVPISLFIILSFSKRFKEAFAALGVSLLIFSSFIIYGIYYDKELFFGLWQFQMARYDLTFSGIMPIFTNPLLVDRYYLDGWIYFGFFSMFLLLTKNLKKNIFVIFPFLAYFLIFIFGIPNEPGHGWYRYPFYPFLIISIALFLKEYFLKNHLLTLFFFLIVGLSLFQLTWMPVFGFSYAILRGTIFIYSLTLIPVFINTKSLKKPIKILNYLIFISLIIMNIWSVLIYNEQ